MKINDAKEIIYKFFNEQAAVFCPEVSVFWRGTRQEMPKYPFIMLADSGITRINKRFECFQKDGREYSRKEMRLTITFGVYTLNDEGNLADSDKLVLKITEFIQDLFTKTQSTFDTLCVKGITVNELLASDIRDLNITSEAGHEFHKEIDIVFEYEDLTEFIPEYGQYLDADIKVEG